MDNFIEKYIDLTDIDAQEQLYKHIANGWTIYYIGLTIIILRLFTEE